MQPSSLYWSLPRYGTPNAKLKGFMYQPRYVNGLRAIFHIQPTWTGYYVFNLYIQRM